MRHESFETPAGVVLDLEVAAGEIDVAAVAGAGETTVDLEPLGGDDADRTVAEARVETRPGRDDATELIVHVPEGRRFGVFRDSVEVRITVRCPEGAHLRARAASADVRAHGRLAGLDVATASGDVEVEAVDGEVRAKTASGDVRLGRIAGDARVRTASGDVAIGVAESSLEVATASGDLRIDEVASGRVTLKAASGDVRVGVRQGTGVWIDARSMSGDTTSELDLGVEPSGQEAGPTVELEVSTMSGDVAIVRAAARAELER